jgi:hypothetical protein
MSNKMMSALEREFQTYQVNKPFYTVVLNSLNAYSKTGTGANICSYRFDWTTIPDVPYEVHMTYMGEVNNIDDTTIAMVYVDLGVPPNVYEARTATVALASNYIGFLESYIVGANSFLHAEDGTNQPISINGRPRNNDFTVRVLNNDGNPFTAFSATALGEYVICLRFIPLK